MMIRNLKALGLALVAVFAMSALSASAASAAEFHSEKTNTSVSAGQTTQHRFDVNTGEVICSNASFTGEQAATTAASLSIAPSYSGCEFEGLFEVAVNTNGCDYVFKASSATAGTVDIATCGTNKYIQVGSLATCRVRVGEQANKGPISYTQSGNKVLVGAAVTGLTYEESGLFCAGSGGSNGTYNGTSLTTGTSGGSEVKIFVE